MSVPTPPKALDGHCSTINDEQLYVLSSTSFQSIALTEGASWTTETVGQAVTGAACAKIGNGTAAALYVIGGTSSDSSYTGLQRYVFSNKTWETLSPPVDVMVNRLNHSASYLQDSNKILVYAGSPSDQPTWLSSQTFTILAESPYTIDSYVSKGHTANLPILESWNSSHAIMTGGSGIDATVMLFSAEDGWSQYATSLSSPLEPGVKGSLITGSDGSKILQTYDLSVSPNAVSSVLLQGADGQPAQVGTTLGKKRDLTAANWPTYNSTIAPTITRSDYSVASDGESLVAFAGGNSAQSIELFNQSTNGWIDSGAYFNATSTSTSSATASSTSAATQSSDTSAATTSAGVSASTVADATSRQHSLLALELGVIIGVLGGLFLIFLLTLLCLRRRRQRREMQEKYGEFGRMSFADRGASFMKEAEGSTQNFFPTADRYNNSSRLPPVAPAATRYSRFSKGRFSLGSGRNSGRGSKIGHKSNGSWESTRELVDKESGLSKEAGYSVEPVEMQPVGAKMGARPIIRKPAPIYRSDKAEIASVLGLAPIESDAARRNRSSGWSRYFSTSQPSQEEGGLGHLPEAYRKPLPVPVQEPVSAYKASYAPSSKAPEHLPASSLMPPLNIDFTKTLDGQRLSKVASSIPSYSNSNQDLAKRGSVAEPQAGRIENSETRPVSTMTTSSYSKRRTRSSIAASEYFANQHGINGTWTPMTTSFKDHVNNADDAVGPGSRRTSSMYTNSIYGDSQSRRKSGSASFFPGAGSSSGKKSKKNSYVAPEEDWENVKSELRPPSEFVKADAAYRESNVTVFPEPIGDTYTAVGRGPSQKSSHAVGTGSGLAGLTTASNNAADRGSNMTLFPRAVSSTKQYPGVGRETEVHNAQQAEQANDAAFNTDVSWVNLGIGSAK